MRMEYLVRGDSSPLIRLFDYADGEVDQLRFACLGLAYGHIRQFALHEQAWCRAVGDCRLVWAAASEDGGIRLAGPGEPFVLRCSREGWLAVEGKLQPFSESREGYNWLAEEAEVALLISWTGEW